MMMHRSWQTGGHMPACRIEQISIAIDHHIAMGASGTPSLPAPHWSIWKECIPEGGEKPGNCCGDDLK
jgi:hypothetical protein